MEPKDVKLWEQEPEKRSSLYWEASQGVRETLMQVFPFSPAPITCQCLSLAKPIQKPLSQGPGKQPAQVSFWGQGWVQERARAGKGWNMIANRRRAGTRRWDHLSTILFPWVSANIRRAGNRFTSASPGSIHHVFSDWGRLVTTLPVEDLISPSPAKWLVGSPCGRKSSPNLATSDSIM